MKNLTDLNSLIMPRVQLTQILFTIKGSDCLTEAPPFSVHFLENNKKTSFTALNRQ